MKNQKTKHLNVLGIIALLFLIWGILGLLDMKNYTYSGYRTDGNNTIIEVEEDSPAEKAGMLVEDVMKQYDGIAVTDTKALSKRDRNKVGDQIEIVVSRNGEDTPLTLIIASSPIKDKVLNIVAFFIGLVFLSSSLFAHYKVNSNLSLLFSLFALFFGYNFLSGLYIENELLEKIVNSIGNFVLIFSLVFLTHFILSFPPSSKFLDRKSKYMWLYTPAIFIILFFWIVIFLQPDSTSGFNQFVRLLVGVLLAGYFGISLVVFIVKYAKASSDIRIKNGLNLMLLGTIVGLAPILLIILFDTISPKTIVPGSDYLFLTMGVIPILFAVATIKQNKMEVVDK